MEELCSDDLFKNKYQVSIDMLYSFRTISLLIAVMHSTVNL